MRIVAGKFRGRALATPDHDGLRPTSDRTRESVFNILAHGIAEFDLQGARVIDLFAGTGALGLEALSRGAAYCLFVEDNADARALIRGTIETLGLTGETRIFKRDATDLGPASKNDRYGLAFLDPPYGKGLAEKALSGLLEGSWLTSNAICVVEDRAGSAFTLPAGLTEFDKRTWGETEVRFLRVG
jgi:16S rRNA (guanine966-N2)-methyltransferase